MRELVRWDDESGLLSCCKFLGMDCIQLGKERSVTGFEVGKLLDASGYLAPASWRDDNYFHPSVDRLLFPASTRVDEWAAFPHSLDLYSFGLDRECVCQPVVY